jgi:hypothetical protein
MPRRNNRSRDGLFDWGAHGEITPGEILDNPQDRPCPACHAAAGKPCRVRSRARQRKNGYHPSRLHPQLSTED